MNPSPEMLKRKEEDAVQRCTLARERARPVLKKVQFLIGRAGEEAFQELFISFQARSEARVESEQGVVTVMNTHIFKATLNALGSVLSPEEIHVLMGGFSDAIGLLLVDDFLHAIGGVPDALWRKAAYLQRLRVSVVREKREIPLETVRKIITMDGKDSRSATAHDATAEALSAADLQLFNDTFSRKRYPTQLVPPEDFIDFFLRFPDSTYATDETLFAKLTGGEKASGLAVPHAASHLPEITSRSRICSQDVFAEYNERDNRDRWLKETPAHQPSGMYRKYTVGYSGHLPTYASRFGRTFHVIEEDLPNLTKPNRQRANDESAIPFCNTTSALDISLPRRPRQQQKIYGHHFTFS